MSNSKRKEIIERYLAAYNAFDIEGMLAVMSPDIRFENYSGDHLTVATSGIAEFRQLAEQSRSLFSEREQRITALQIDSESAIARIAYRGRLAVDIPDGPAAGMVIELQGESEFFFIGAQISRIIDRS